MNERKADDLKEREEISGRTERERDEGCRFLGLHFWTSPEGRREVFNF